MFAADNSFFSSSLRNLGCVRIAVNDPKRLNEQRNRIAVEAARLGRSVNCSYRHPWLYVTLAGHVEQFRETTAFRVLEAA